jgi:osmotically-inducible protein OsmY
MPSVCPASAFAGALIATLVLAAACASTPPPMPLQTRGDVAIANRVYAALNADPIYYFRHVNVEVDDGIANLSGYVWSADAIYRARQIARAVPGIQRVVTSQLELEREGRTNGLSR